MNDDSRRAGVSGQWRRFAAMAALAVAAATGVAAPGMLQDRNPAPPSNRTPAPPSPRNPAPPSNRNPAPPSRGEDRTPPREDGDRRGDSNGRAERKLPNIPIDLDHILKGRVNGRGVLVGMHHQPSAPRQMRANGVMCNVEFEPTSPGGPADVTTARVRLRDPKTRQVVLEKFSTLFPSDWTADQIERAIREAFADAQARGRISEDGKWGGRTRSGIPIDGYLSYDGEEIATAFPVYQAPRGSRSRR